MQQAACTGSRTRRPRPGTRLLPGSDPSTPKATTHPTATRRRTALLLVSMGRHHHRRLSSRACRSSSSRSSSSSRAAPGRLPHRAGRRMASSGASASGRSRRKDRSVLQMLTACAFLPSAAALAAAAAGGRSTLTHQAVFGVRAAVEETPALMHALSLCAACAPPFVHAGHNAAPTILRTTGSGCRTATVPRRRAGCQQRHCHADW